MNQALMTIAEEGVSKHGSIEWREYMEMETSQLQKRSKLLRIFDAFLGKLILYLSTSKGKNRFVLEYNPITTNSRETKNKGYLF